MPKYNHVMLDLETLSTRTGAAILQIAAVAFDIETGEADESGALNVYVRGWDAGAHVEPRTVLWWMQQPRAKALAEKCERDGVYLGSAIDMLGCWYRTADAYAQLGDTSDSLGSYDGIEGVWCHGLTFDLPILDETSERCGLGLMPWHYRTPRDTRTLFAVAPGGMPRPPVDETRKHDALYDCMYQIRQVSEAWRRCKAARDALELVELAGKVVADAVAVADTERSDASRPVIDVPAWSAAEGRAEAYANPDASPDSVCEGE